MPGDIAVFAVIALLFIAGLLLVSRWYFCARGYKKHYTNQVTTEVTAVRSLAGRVSIITYEAVVDGIEETLVGFGSVGAPMAVVRPGDKITLLVHDDPDRRRRVSLRHETRPFVCTDFLPWDALFFKLMGLGSIGAGVLMAVIYSKII